MAILLVLSKVAMAVPYSGEQSFTYYQPNGESFQVRLNGDEFFAYQETEDGYLIIRDPKNGDLCYAKITGNGSDIVSTGVRVGQAKPIGLKPKQRLKPGKAMEKSRAQRDKLGTDERGRLKQELRSKFFPNKKKKQQSEPDPQSSPALDDDPQAANDDGSTILPSPPNNTTTGQRVGLLLLASFPDRQSDINKTVGEMEDYCNAEIYTDNGNATSIHGYFKIQSDEKLLYTNVVTAWFTAAHERDYYTDPDISYSSRAKELIKEGLAILDAQGFDFNECDANDDGVIDGINIFYAGSRVNAWSEGIWPHKSSTSWSGFSAHGLSTSFQYQITDMPSNLGIGTFVHENGHMICGFPDLYSYDGNASSVGPYSVMASSGSKHPVDVDPYLKIHAGWADVIDLNSASHQLCAVQDERNFFYRYRNPADPNEYFLFDVRSNTGYEGPYGGTSDSVNPTTGLVVFHALESGKNTSSTIVTSESPNCDYSTPYELMVVEANPSSSTTPWYDNPTPGSNDAFKSTDVDELSDGTSPALKFWAADGRTVASGLHVHSVSATGSTMTFIAGTGALTSPAAIAVTATELIASQNLGASINDQEFAVFNSGSGTISYTISDDADWLDCTPAAGDVTTEATPIAVSFTTSGLAADTYTATITIDGGSAGTETIEVSITVWEQPTIAVNTTSLSVFGIEGEAGVTAEFEITNSGGGTGDYTLTASDSWMSLSRTAGSVAGETDRITVTFDATTLDDGTYNGSIELEAPSATNPEVTIPVSFVVQSTDLLITYPNGGESFRYGEDLDITWLTTLGGTVKIELLQNGTPHTLITSATANDGLYRWSLPFSISEANDYAIRITSVENPSLVDTGNATFSILAVSGGCSSFENDFDGWEQDGSDDFDWSRDSGGTSSSSTGPSTGSDGSWYLYTEASGNSAKTANIYKDFNFASQSAPALSFDYHMYGLNMGALYLEASTDGGSTWDSPSAWSASGNKGDIWNTANVDLSAYSGMANVRLRFRGATGNDYTSDMAIDNICLEDNVTDGIRFTNSIVYCEEMDGSVIISAQRIGDLLGEASVQVATSNGTADSSDFTPTSTTLNWTDGEGGVKSFTVPITDDDTGEPDETVLLTLSGASGDLIVGVNPISLFIMDGNELPTVFAGYDQTAILSGGATPLATTGADIFLDAGLDDGVDTTWEDSANTWDLSINSGVNFVADAGSAWPGVTSSYRFPGGTSGSAGCDGSSLQDMGADKNPITLELWFRPIQSTTYPSNGQVLFETGGGTGIGIFYNNGFVETAHDSDSGQMSWDVSSLTGEFIQVVVTYDPTSSSDNYKLYINGDLKATSSRSDTDMCGGDGSGLGNRGENNVGGAGGGDSNTESFEGDIAIFRAYHNRILNDSEVLVNYGSIAGAKSATVNLDATVSDVDEDPLTTSWTVVSGPSGISFGDSGAVDTTAAFYSAGDYTLRLTADDGTVQSSHEVVITVVESYTVIYAGNGDDAGVLPYDSSLYLLNDTVTVLSHGTLSRSKYDFTHWNTQADGLGTSYSPSDTFQITNDMSLHAQWLVQPALELTIAAETISEGSGLEATTATVTRNTDTTNALTVNLSSNDTSEADVVSSVIIPSGQTSTDFNIVAIDEGLIDGEQTVTITASAAGHASGSDTIIVNDDEVGFDNWIEGYDVGSETGFDDDYDGDSLVNGIESYFGTDPSTYSRGLSAGSVVKGATDTFTFTHPLNANPADDLSAAYIWSKDMQTFYYSGETDVGGTTVNFSQGTLTVGIVPVTATISGTPATQLFIRIEVKQAAP